MNWRCPFDHLQKLLLTVNREFILSSNTKQYSSRFGNCADIGCVAFFCLLLAGRASRSCGWSLGGSLTLSGANSYSGGTVLNAGTLIVNNARALGLGNMVVNGGILRADPQPINVKENYTQTGGTLQLQVAGANPGQYDTLNVGGNASLGGRLAAALPWIPSGGG